MLLHLKRADADEQIANLLKASDAQMSYLILSNIKRFYSTSQAEEIFSFSANNERFGNLVNVVQNKHGEIATLFANAIVEQEKIGEISHKRSIVTNPDLRFFLAVLMNVSERERVFSLVKERFPDSDPLDKVLDWTFDLSTTKTFGANMTNALGIADFDDNDLMALEFLLKDLDESGIRDSLKNDYGLSDTDDWLKNLPSRNEKLRASVVLQALLN
jgi:hypothetical protein